VLIAVVDDDPFARTAMCRLLIALGFQVEAWASAEDYLEDSSMQRASCLLLDVHFPGMSGLELQRRLREKGSRIPIVFVTGSHDEQLRQEALARGAVDLLHKPVSEEALLSAIRSAFAPGKLEGGIHDES
jgi:FixJ family two-component response regulator